jgi:hypothetical protein
MVQISNHNNCADGTKTEIGLSYTVTFYTKYAGWYKFHCPLDVDFGAFILFNGDVVSATYDEVWHGGDADVLDFTAKLSRGKHVI